MSQVSLRYFTSIWWITVNMLVISVMERYFRLGLKYLIPLEKSYLLDINYCTNYVHRLLQHYLHL